MVCPCLSLMMLQVLMETRVCGSPAVGGYQRVNVSCILQSPTARWLRDYTAAGGRYEDMVVHIEQQADYDGELLLLSRLLSCMGWLMSVQFGTLACEQQHGEVLTDVQ
eukprot:GHUV01010859.1.p1 GENE.GHUV01010859.1~~GHUV01010859.1.p1  ORF type:complete len:108 (+),score=33.87 GHUV01010859.1:1020-1343(+)